MEKLLSDIKKNARLKEKEPRATELETKVIECIDKFLPHYAEKLGYTELEILTAIEKRRDYWAANYYQAAKFPNLDDVHIFENEEELRKACPSIKFRCPMCKHISKNPYECNSGEEMSEGKICDWKSYGFFGTLDKGFTFTLRSTFLEHGKIETIFMPIEFEEKETT